MQALSNGRSRHPMRWQKIATSYEVIAANPHPLFRFLYYVERPDGAPLAISYYTVTRRLHLPSPGCAAMCARACTHTQVTILSVRARRENLEVNNFRGALYDIVVRSCDRRRQHNENIQNGMLTFFQ